MSSMIQYIRQLNQESVQIRDEWLQQLQFCALQTKPASLDPEIMVTAPLDNVDTNQPTAESPQTVSATLDRCLAADKSDVTEVLADLSTSQSYESSTIGHSPDTISQAVTESTSNVSSSKPGETMSIGIHGNDEHPQIMQDQDSVVSVRRFEYAPVKRHKKIDSLTNHLVDRFPAVEPATLMFVGVSREVDVDSVSAKIATCLSLREVGEIMLVDANMTTRDMSRELSVSCDSGVAEIVNRNVALESAIRTTDNARLKLLPAGSGQLTHRKLDHSRVRRLTTALKRRFQYTIISGGCVGDLLADVWASYVDAVYVLIEMAETDRHHAIDAVNYLRQMGARVAGCVTTQR